MADLWINVFSFLGLAYVLITKLLSGDLGHLDELWDAPHSLAQQNSLLPPFEGNARLLAENFANDVDPLDRTMDSLLSMLNYFDKRIDEDPVIDVFITIRMIADYCRHLNSSLLHDEAQRAKLGAIVSLADDVVKRGAVVIQLSDPNYYNQLGEALYKEMFHVRSTSRSLPNVTYDKSLLQDDVFNSAKTDDCFNEIFSCKLSDSCWQKMAVNLHQSGYMLTHQVLYTIVAQGWCGGTVAEFLDRYNQSSIEAVNDALCGPVYAQSQDLVRDNYPERYHDLFCEQIFVCGMLGYYQFFTFPILDAILSWQDDVGCYKFQKWETVIMYKTMGKRVSKRNELMKNDMCMPHYTVVCEGAIAMFLRFLVENHNLSYPSTV